MKTCSIVMPYYDNYSMLQRHVEEWLKWSEYTTNRLKVVVVDDGSPDHPAIEAIEDMGFNLDDWNVEFELYRILKDVPWNQDGARNLGMRECGTQFALMTDMDHLLPACHAEKMLRFLEEPLQEGTYFMPRQWVHTTHQEIPAHPNTFLFRVSDFWEMGGYDEDFAGHYGSDGNFRKCAKGSGLMEVQTHDFGLIVFRREDIEDANTHRYGRKDSEFYSHKNPKLRDKMKGPAYVARNPIRFEWRREI